MRNRLPRRHELILFLVIAVVGAVIVRLSGKDDVGLALVGAPLFLVSSLIGFRRHCRMNSPVVEESTDAQQAA